MKWTKKKMGRFIMALRAKGLRADLVGEGTDQWSGDHYWDFFVNADQSNDGEIYRIVCDGRNVNWEFKGNARVK